MLFFLLPIKIFAIDKINIYPMYCLSDDAITLKTFGFSGEDNEILNLNGQKAAKISTKKLNEILTANFKTYSDKTGGSVAFVRDCTTIDEVQMAFLRAISDEFNGISIENLSIEPQAKLPNNFNELKFKHIFLNTQNSARGTFRASFEEVDLTSKNLFFKYSFKAKMPVFLALNAMPRGHVLGLLDYQAGTIDFERYQRDYISKFPASTLIARSKIKAGEVLSNRHFNTLSIVKKSDTLNAVLNEDGLSVIIEVKALQDGNLGDTIKVKTRENKVLRATISSPKEAVIR